jgi:hypothetical protein
MIFIHRLGIVLYWVGYSLALLFAIGRLLVALNGLISGGPISEAWSSPCLALSPGCGDGPWKILG